MYVAVITNQDPMFSRREDGDLSCFVRPTKIAAVTEALKAKAIWENRSRHNSKYRVLVGKLSFEAMPIFAEVKL